MSSFNKWLFTLWAAVTAGSIVTLLLPWLTPFLMLTGIGIPLALLLGSMLGLWMYLTPALASYVFLRRWMPRVARFPLLIAAVLPPLAVGIAVPLIANRQSDNRVSALLAGDGGEPLRLPQGASVTHLIDRGLGSFGKCHDDCQRLLLTGTAASYVDAPRDLLGRLGNLPSPLSRFRLGLPDGNCRNTLLTPARASDEEVGPIFPKPLLWDKLDDLGLCLHADRTSDARSDFLMVETWNYDPERRSFQFDGQLSQGSLIELELHPIAPFRRWEIYRIEVDRLTPVMRRTHVEHARLSVPLWLLPGFAFDTYTPAHWALTDHRSSGQDIDVYRLDRWEPWITNDLAVRGLEPETITVSAKRRPN